MPGPLADRLLIYHKRRLTYRQALLAHRQLAYGDCHDVHFGIRADGRVYWLEQQPEDPTWPDDRFIGDNDAEASRWVVRTKPIHEVGGLFVELLDLQECWDLEHEPQTDPRPEWNATYHHQHLGTRS